MKRALLLLMMILLLAVCTAAWAENGQLPKPNAWLEECRITEGETVVIHVDKTENAAQFSSYVFKIGDETEIILDTIKKPGVIKFTPEYSGVYCVSVTCEAPGYKENTIWLPFLVTSADFQDFSNEKMNLFVDKTSVSTFEDSVRVLAFCPETEYFVLRDNGKAVAEGEFGFGIDLSFGWGKAGDHVLTVGYPDAGGEMIYPEDCSVTIHAVAEKGSLPQPNAWLEECRVTEGDSIVIHVDKTENAAQFSSYIFKIGDETEIILDTIKKPGEIKFTPEYSGVYCVSVTCQAPGYEENTIWLPFLVTSADFQDFSNETVNLFVDKTTVDTFEDTVRVMAFYPEAKYFVLYDNGEPVTEEEFTFGIDLSFGWGKAGDHVLTVGYVVDDGGKMIYPKNCSVTIHAVAINGSLPEPNAWLEDCRITKGDSVVIHVDETENAAQFGTYVFRIGDRSEIILDTIKKPGEIKFTPEYSGVYFVSVTCQAPGYEENTIWLPLLVTSGDFQDFSNETVNLFVDKTTVDTFEDYVHVLAFHPETKHFILYDNGEVLAEEFNYGVDLSFGYGKAGDHVLTVSYEDASGKMIYPENCSVTIHAVAEKGQLPQPNAWLEDCRITEGDSVVIHVEKTENAAQFGSYVFRIGDYAESILDTIKKPGEIKFKPDSSGVYYVSVTSQAPGYEENTVWLPFLVTSGNYQDFSNETVNLFVDKTTVGTFEDTVHVLAFFPEAEYFVLYDNGETLAEGEYVFGIDQNFGWGKEGDHVLTVSYEDASGKMIYPKNCSVTIHAVADNGPLPEPNASIGESVVSLGETAVIHIADTANAVQFGGWAYHHLYQEEYPIKTIKGTGDIPFTLDSSGYYSLVIVAQAPGYEESEKVLPLMVVDEKDECFRTDDFVFTFSTSQFDPDTDIHMSVFYPGADGVHLYDIGNQLPGDVNWDEMAGEGVWASEPGLDTWVSWAHPGTHNICISACINDIWTQPVQVCTLLVNSANDILNSADQILPSDLIIIEEEAFLGVNAITVRLGDEVESIGSGAFAECADLEEIYIPATVTSIGSDAFAGCSDHLCIRGYANSFAEAYARNNGIQFLPIE